MMKFNVKRQDSYSRGELILRFLFGPFYIMLPHAIVQGVLGIGLMFIKILTFWVILFTGKFPKSWFEYNVKMMRYSLRVSARTLNLADGYPAFGLNGTDTQTEFDVTYQEEVSRGSMLLRAFFGVFMIIPHAFILIFRLIGVMFCNFIGFWAILFTGSFPQGMFDFIVKTFRWNFRIQCYLSYLTHVYPPFTGDVLPGEETAGGSSSKNDDILDA
jgi:hypothetical protein